MIGPSMTVKDALAQAQALGAEYKSDGPALITVELVDSAALTEDGSFAIPTWTALAYKWSDGGRALAGKLLAGDEAAALAAAEERERREEKETTMAVSEFVSELKSVVLTADRPRSDTFLRQSWPLLRTSLISEDRLDTQSIKRAVLSKFNIIFDAFRYTSSQSLVSEADFTMCFSELRHFLDVTGALAFPKDAAVLDRAVASILPPKFTSSPKRYRLNALNFIEVLALIAKYKVSMDKRAEAEPGAALERFVDSYCYGLVSKVNTGNVRQLLRSEAVHRLLPKVGPYIFEAVQYYSNKPVPAREDTVMCLTQPALAALLKDSGLLNTAAAAGESTESLSAKQAKALFDAVQEHVTMDGSAGLRRQGESQVYSELILSEVLEAIGYAGIARWASARDVPDGAKVTRAIQLVARLSEMLGSSLSAMEVDSAFSTLSSTAEVFLTDGDVSFSGV